MQQAEMNNLVSEELERLLPHSGPDRELRNFYAMRRKNCLKNDHRQTPASSFHKAVEDVRKHAPGFSPNFREPEQDAEYFSWHEKRDKGGA